jgi:plastocyanin
VRSESPLVVLALLAAALSCTNHDSAPAAVDAKSSDLTGTLAKFEKVAPARGSIEGLVVFDGVAPARVPINTAAEGGCGLDPNEPALTEAWVVNAACFANVFVWLENPPRDSAGESGAREPIVLHQRGCVYRPHAIGLRAGQTLRITNEDRARHNVHSMPRHDENPSFNQSQSEGAPPFEVVFSAAEVAIPIVCDFHPWMKAWVGVFDHPYFAVTGADGRFTWSGLPPGEYHVRAWHEVLGKLTGSVTLGAESGARICLTYHPKT